MLAEWFEQIGKSFTRNFIAEQRYLWLLEGLGNTLIISALAIIIGVIIGLVLAYMKLSKIRVFGWIADVYLDIIRGTPSFIQLLIIYFVIFSSLGINKIIVGAIAFGINSGAYVAEIIRAGILSVDHGQTEAGYSLGLNPLQTMVYIVIPQAVKNILPTLANEFIVLIKETAVVGYIAVRDITKAATTIQSKTYDAAFPLIAAAVIYYIIIKILSTAFRMMEKSLRKSDYRA